MFSKIFLKNNRIRCFKCYKIPFLYIIPNVDQLAIKLNCNCGISVLILEDYFSKQFSQKIKQKIVCNYCLKPINNIPTYCSICMKNYCNICNIEHIKKNESHLEISYDKIDSFCLIHQDKNYNAYCNKCKKNICEDCLEEHNKHKIEMFKDLLFNKEKTEQFKFFLKEIKEKLKFNEKLYKNSCKKYKKFKKEIEENFKINDKKNKMLLNFIEYFYDIYKEIEEEHKSFNYQIIMNLKINSIFNINVYKNESNSLDDDEVEKIIKYFKTDLIIFNGEEMLNKKLKIEKQLKKEEKELLEKEKLEKEKIEKEKLEKEKIEKEKLEKEKLEKEKKRNERKIRK